MRINTVMQTCFFAISGVLPRDEAIGHIKKTIEKTYERKGADVVRKNFEAVDQTLANLHEVKIAGRAGQRHGRARPPSREAAPDFVQRVTALMLAGKGDLLPVSAFPVDGTWPTGTAQWEKRTIALDIPVWEPSLCIQCNKCALICPHACIRPKFFEPAALAGRAGHLQVDGLQVAHRQGEEVHHPGGAGRLHRLHPLRRDLPGRVEDREGRRRRSTWPSALPLKRGRAARTGTSSSAIPEPDRAALKLDVKGTQFLQPLFEFSGACTGCGETPYIKLLTQLYGDRAIIANATGCSSIYGANLPTTPYTKNDAGRGPAWANSLFEDNAEFGYGMRLAVDKQAEHARELLAQLGTVVGDDLVKALLEADQSDEKGLEAQRARIALLKGKLGGQKRFEAVRLSGRWRGAPHQRGGAHRA